MLNLSNFMKQESIGKGDFGEIYRFKNIHTENQYSVKIYYDDLNKYHEKFIEKITNDLDHLSDLNNSYISSIIGYSFNDIDEEKHLLTFSDNYLYSLYINRALFFPSIFLTSSIVMTTLF